MGHSYGVGGSIGTVSWRLYRRHPRELGCAERAYVHAPVLRAFRRTLCKRVLCRTGSYQARDNIYRWEYIEYQGLKPVHKTKTCNNRAEQGPAQQNKTKSQQPVRRKATKEEGAGLSRPQSVRKPRPVPADSRRTTPSQTPTV